MAFLQELFFVGASLSDDFVPLEAEDELRLCPDVVVTGDLRGDVAIDLDDFDVAEAVGDEADVLVGDFAGGVPLGSEVDQHIGVFVDFQVLVKDLQLVKLLDGSKTSQQSSKQHIISHPQIKTKGSSLPIY